MHTERLQGVRQKLTPRIRFWLGMGILLSVFIFIIISSFFPLNLTWDVFLCVGGLLTVIGVVLIAESTSREEW